MFSGVKPRSKKCFRLKAKFVCSVLYSEWSHFSTAQQIYKKTDGQSKDKLNLRLFEIAFVLVRFDHIARRIVNANHGVM